MYDNYNMNYNSHPTNSFYTEDGSISKVLHKNVVDFHWILLRPEEINRSSSQQEPKSEGKPIHDTNDNN